jgi:hypothetical protein
MVVDFNGLNVKYRSMCKPSQVENSRRSQRLLWNIQEDYIAERQWICACQNTLDISYNKRLVWSELPRGSPFNFRRHEELIYGLARRELKVPKNKNKHHWICNITGWPKPRGAEAQIHLINDGHDQLLKMAANLPTYECKLQVKKVFIKNDGWHRHLMFGSEMESTSNNVY